MILEERALGFTHSHNDTPESLSAINDRLVSS